MPDGIGGSDVAHRAQQRGDGGVGGAVVGAVDDVQSGGEGGVRIGSNRCRDAYRQRAAGQFVVGEEHQRASDRIHQFDGRLGRPGHRQALGNRAAVRATDEARGDRDQASGGGRCVVAVIARQHRCCERQRCHRRPRAGGGERRAARGQRRAVDRPGRFEIGEAAGPEQFGDTFERARRRQGRDVVTAIAKCAVVEGGDRRLDRHVDRCPLRRPASRSGSQPFDLVAGIQRGPPVG